MKQLLKVCVADDTSHGGVCRYVGFYETLRHKYFEIRVVEHPEGGEESARTSARFDFSAKDYLNVHVAALFQYIQCVQAHRQSERTLAGEPVAREAPGH